MCVCVRACARARMCVCVCVSVCVFLSRYMNAFFVVGGSGFSFFFVFCIKVY